MNALQKLKSELANNLDIEQSEFDRLQEIKISQTKNLPLACMATLMAFKEKKKRNQFFNVEIKIPLGGGECV